AIDRRVVRRWRFSGARSLPRVLGIQELVRRLLPVIISVIAWPCLTANAIARDLTFDDRVKAQEVIERVDYSHQVGTTRRFEDAVPRQLLESKVSTYLKQTAALEEVWHTALTP